MGVWVNLGATGAYPGCSPDYEAQPGMEARSQPLLTLRRAVVRAAGMERPAGRDVAAEFKYEACVEFVSKRRAVLVGSVCECRPIDWPHLFRLLP